MDGFLLKFLLRFCRLFFKKNIDFQKLQVITQTKVMMDRRRSPATWKRKQQKELKNPLLITQIVYAFFGMLIGILVFSMKSLLVSMIFLHAYLLFMMAMTLITDFSSVLLDTTDNQIILPRPVNSRTLFIARIIHILVYLLQFLIALTLFPVVFTFIKYGLTVGCCLIITMLLTVAFTVFITYLLYGLMLQFGNEQKIKDIIGYFQIFMTIFFAIGYQVLPRLIDFDNENFSFNLHWYSYLLPPVWMSMSLEAVHTASYDWLHLLMIATSFIIPILTTWLMMRFLAPSFSRKLGALNNNSEVSKKPHSASAIRFDLPARLSRLFCISKTEAAGFEKVWKITARDKNFKIQFYPSLAYLLVFAFVFVFKSGKNIAGIWQHLSETKMFLWFVYLPMFSISTCLNIVPFNDNFAAAWVYQAVPLARPGEIITGTIKSLLVKFFLPVYLILFAFAFYVWGIPVVDDFILGFFNNILIFLMMSNLGDHNLPFSRQPNIKQQSGKFIKIILQLILIGLLVGLHFLALRVNWLPAALIPVSAVAGYFLFKRLQQLPWLKISV